MQLYLCGLKHIKNFEYDVVDSTVIESGYVEYMKTAFEIQSLDIDASIFSPLVLKVVCTPNKYNKDLANKIIPYNSVYGVALIEKYSPSVAKYHTACLFSGHSSGFVPFVVLSVRPLSDNSSLYITLMEKRALSLALTHSFACISRQDRSLDNTAFGLLSIPIVIGELSKIPEEEDEVNGVKINNKAIINFAGDIIEYDEKFDIEEHGAFINYEKYSCAFLSRFVAPGNQSRLEIILSLMHKYGYGFAYRASDRQYHAVDLLSNVAPGFCTGGTTHCVTGDYDDRYCFVGGETRAYFRCYAADFYATNPHFETRFKDFEEYKNKTLRENEFDYFSHDFADFYGERLVARCSTATCPDFYTVASHLYDYSCASRHSPLFSTCDYPVSVDNSSNKYSFGLSIITSLAFQDKKNVNNYLSEEKRCLESVLIQNSQYSYQQGTQRCMFEDEVELMWLARYAKKNSNRHYGLDKDSDDSLDKDSYEGSDKKNAVQKCGIIDPLTSCIQTVNQRINYAKYKLDHMQKNYFTQKFIFRDNGGLSYNFNIVYELLQWLGFHTDLFMKIRRISEIRVNKKKSATLSGATHDFTEAMYRPGWLRDGDTCLWEFLVQTRIWIDLLTFPCRNAPVIFGKFHIRIEKESCKKDKPYCLSATLTFFSDFLDYNWAQAYLGARQPKDKNEIDYGNIFKPDETIEDILSESSKDDDLDPLGIDNLYMPDSVIQKNEANPLTGSLVDMLGKSIFDDNRIDLNDLGQFSRKPVPPFTGERKPGRLCKGRTKSVLNLHKPDNSLADIDNIEFDD